MSADADRSQGVKAEDVVDSLRERYHYLVLAALMGFMLGVRLMPFDRFSVDGGLRLQAVDSYYHWRTTEWTVNNFPFTMPYDVFTGYPTGRYVGQFGTLFDQFIATLAMIIGLGSPSESNILLAVLIGVPIIATLVAIPVYLIGARLSGRLGGLVGVAILAFVPGQFLTRSTAGQFQHHAAEVLFMAISIFVMMLALRVAEREKPVFELVVDRDWDALRRPAAFSAVAGIALGMYMWIWPPGVVLVGILGFFFIVAIAVDHVRGVSPEPIAFVGAVSLAVTGVMTLVLLEVWTVTSVTSMGLLQPLLALLVAGGCVVMAGLSRVWYRRRLNPLGYPAAVAGAAVVGLALVYLVLPDLYSILMNNLTGRLLPFDPSIRAGTISEARPPDDPSQFLFDEFGLAFFTMLVGLGALLARPFGGKSYRAEHTLIIIWSVFLISMTLTQVRFAYYLVLAVAVVNAYLFGAALDWFDLSSFDHIRDIKGYQVLSLLIIFMVLFVPLLPPIASTSAVDVGQAAGPSDDGIVWNEANDFLRSSSPTPGDWGEHSNAGDLEYLGWYDHPGGDGYDYPPGSYGVMSWWDYGHLITTQANRIPHANPFQQNAASAASYLLANDEERAELILDAIEASGDGVGHLNDAELQAIVDEHDGELTTDMRYVMIDDQMVGGKFAAKTQWTGDGFAPYLDEDQFEFRGQNETLLTAGQAYWETIMVQLYRNDGQGLEHYRLVHEVDQFSIVGGILAGGQVNTLASLRIEGGWEQVQQADFALQQSNQQGIINEDLIPGFGFYDAGVYSSVKTFERVEGATLSGTVSDVNNSVLVQVELETNTNRTFTYVNFAEPDDDGHWNLTVPYATSNELGPEDGYTDTAVEALGSYTIYEAEHPHLVDQFGFPLDGIAHVNVSEQAIYDGEEIDVEFSEPANFAIDEMSAPMSVDINETFQVSTTITNTGGVSDEQTVWLQVGGDFVQDQSITLEPGESTTITFDHAIEEEGQYQLGIVTDDGSRNVGITVGDPPIDDNDDDENADSMSAVPIGRVI